MHLALPHSWYRTSPTHEAARLSPTLPIQAMVFGIPLQKPNSLLQPCFYWSQEERCLHGHPSRAPSEMGAHQRCLHLPTELELQTQTWESFKLSLKSHPRRSREQATPRYRCQTSRMLFSPLQDINKAFSLLEQKQALLFTSPCFSPVLLLAGFLLCCVLVPLPLFSFKLEVCSQ